MPIELKLKTSTSEAAYEETQGLMLFNEDGELTLAGETVAEFLATADFSSVVESDDAAPFLVIPEDSDEDGEDVFDEARMRKPSAWNKGVIAYKGAKATYDGKPGANGLSAGDQGVVLGISGGKVKVKWKSGVTTTEFHSDVISEDVFDDGDFVTEVALPGVVAARLVDEGDLVDMFGYFLDQLAENDDPTLQEQATLAVFESLRDFAGGIDEDSREEVAELLLTVLGEGFVYGDLDEKNMTKGARRKAQKIRNRPQSGARRAKNKKRKREEGRGAKKALIARQHKMRNRRKQSRIKQLARESEEGTLVFGLGEGVDGARFRIGLAEDPNMVFTDAQLIEFDELGGYFVECPNEDCMIESTFAAFVVEAKKKAKKKKKDADGDYDDSDAGEKDEDDYENSVTLESCGGVCPECGCVVEDLLDEKGKVPPAFLKHMKGKKKDSDDDGDGSDADEKKTKKKDESLAPSNVPGAFAVAAGRPNLSEGHSLAAATLGVLGGRKLSLTEGED